MKTIKSYTAGLLLAAFFIGMAFLSQVAAGKVKDAKTQNSLIVFANEKGNGPEFASTTISKAKWEVVSAGK